MRRERSTSGAVDPIASTASRLRAKLEIYLDDYTGEFMTTPTNLAFGGNDMCTLYLAALAGWSVNAVECDVPGHPLPRPG